MANSINKTDDAQVDFQQGTLTNVIATSDGKLQLKTTTTELAKTLTSYDDFAQGTAVGTVITGSGSVELGTEGADVSRDEDLTTGTMEGVVYQGGGLTLPKGTDVLTSDDYTHTLTHAVVVDHQLTLSKSGSDLSFTEGFSGSKNNVTITESGLTLSREADINRVESTEADFNQGVYDASLNILPEGSVTLGTTPISISKSAPEAVTLTNTNTSLSKSEATDSDFNQGTSEHLSIEGNTMTLAESYSHYEAYDDFKTGTSTNVIFTDSLELDGGDLVLGENTVTNVVNNDTQAELSTGTLDHIQATEDGHLVLAEDLGEIDLHYTNKTGYDSASLSNQVTTNDSGIIAGNYNIISGTLQQSAAIRNGYSTNQSTPTIPDTWPGLYDINGTIVIDLFQNSATDSYYLANGSTIKKYLLNGNLVGSYTFDADHRPSRICLDRNTKDLWFFHYNDSTSGTVFGYHQTTWGTNVGLSLFKSFTAPTYNGATNYMSIAYERTHNQIYMVDNNKLISVFDTDGQLIRQFKLGPDSYLQSEYFISIANGYIYNQYNATTTTRYLNVYNLAGIYMTSKNLSTSVGTEKETTYDITENSFLILRTSAGHTVNHGVGEYPDTYDWYYSTYAVFYSYPASTSNSTIGAFSQFTIPFDQSSITYDAENSSISWVGSTGINCKISYDGGQTYLSQTNGAPITDLENQLINGTLNVVFYFTGSTPDTLSGISISAPVVSGYGLTFSDTYTTTTDFERGTNNGLDLSNDALQLDYTEPVSITKTEDTQADFAAGTLSNTTATADNSLKLSTVSSGTDGTISNLSSDLGSSYYGAFGITWDDSSNQFFLVLANTSTLNIYRANSSVGSLSNLNESQTYSYPYDVAIYNSTLYMVTGTGYLVSVNKSSGALINHWKISTGACYGVAYDSDHNCFWIAGSNTTVYQVNADDPTDVINSFTSPVGKVASIEYYGGYIYTTYFADTAAPVSFRKLDTGFNLIKTITPSTSNPWKGITFYPGTGKMKVLSDGFQSVKQADMSVQTLSYASTGSRISPAYDFSSVGVISDATLSWEGELPANTTTQMQISTDGSNWTNVPTSGSQLTSLIGQTAANLYTKAILTTNDTTQTPTLGKMTLTVANSGGYAETGSWTSAPMDISVVKEISHSLINYTSTLPSPATLTVSVSPDNGTTWTPVSSNDALLPVGALTATNLLVKVDMTSDGTVSPVVEDLSYTLSSPERYHTSGSRIHMIGLNAVDDAQVEWSADVPDQTSLVVATSLDGSNWVPTTSGANLTTIGSNTTGVLYVRESFATTDTTQTPSLDWVKITTHATGYLASGNRVSPDLDLSTVGQVTTSTLSWDETKPAGTSITIETSTDGGASWSVLTNGAQIPDLNGADTLRIRETLGTTNPDVTPQIHELTLTIDHYRYEATGLRQAPALNLDNLGVLVDSYASWVADTPTNTSVVLECSLDGTNWSPMVNNSPLPVLSIDQNVTGAQLYVRETLSTTEDLVTPTFHSLSLTFHGRRYSLSKVQTIISQSLSTLGVPISSLVSWAEDVPEDTSLLIEGSFDGLTWTPLVNGAALPSIPESINNKTFQIRETLATTDIGVTPTVSDVFFSMDGVSYLTSGVRQSPALNIGLSRLNTSTINWDADMPSGTSLLIETSVDGGASWQAATNNGLIPNLTNGEDLTGKTLLVRQTFTSTNNGHAPLLRSLGVDLVSGYLPTGSHTSEEIDLSQVATVSAMSVTYTKSLPSQTSIQVESRFSQDGVVYTDWAPLAQSSSIPGITKNMDLSHAKLQLRETLASTDSNVTPVISNLALLLSSGYNQLGNHGGLVINLAPVGLVASTVLTYNQTTPTGTTALVESRVSSDDGVSWAAWEPVTSGQAIPSIPAGMDLSHTQVELRETLSTTDTAVTPRLSYLGLSAISGYATTGLYTGLPFNYSAAGVPASSTLNWTATTPAGTSIVVESSVDNGLTWSPVTNGGAIPNLVGHTEVLLREHLNTTNSLAAPKLVSVSVLVESGFAPSGVWISAPINLSTTGVVNSSKITWDSTLPLGTSIIVETSLDNGLTWDVATNGYIIPGINSGIGLPDTQVVIRATLNTTATAVSPSLDETFVSIKSGGFAPAGERVAPALNLNTLTGVKSNQVTWVTDEPEGTTIQVLFALSNSGTLIPPSANFKPMDNIVKEALGGTRYQYQGKINQIIEGSDLSGLYLWRKEILTTEDVN